MVTYTQWQHIVYNPRYPALVTNPTTGRVQDVCSRVQLPAQYITQLFVQHVSAGICQPQPPMPTISCTRRPRRLSHKNSLLYGPHSFAVAGPAMWNSLPASLRNDQLSVTAFRRLLKTELFSRAYNSSLACSWLLLTVRVGKHNFTTTTTTTTTTKYANNYRTLKYSMQFHLFHAVYSIVHY